MKTDQKTTPISSAAWKHNPDHLLGYALGRSDARQGLLPDPYGGPAVDTFARGYIEGYRSVSGLSPDAVVAKSTRGESLASEHESLFQDIVDRHVNAELEGDDEQ